MQELEQEYTRLQSAYQKLAAEAIASDNAEPLIPGLQSANQSIANILGRMLSLLANVRKEGEDLQPYRDELVRRLQKIQYDYNNLKSNTDRLETLRRIREYESSKAAGSLNWYLFGFFGLCVLLLIFMFAFGRQPRNVDTIPAIPTAATIRPPFM